MNSRTKSLQFTKDVRMRLLQRDRGCLFCRMHYRLEKSLPSDRNIFDPMHVVNKSQGGLGVIENGLIGCRFHHHMMDNSEYNHEMREIAMNHMRTLYPGWTEESVTYNKWEGFMYRK